MTSDESPSDPDFGETARNGDSADEPPSGHAETVVGESREADDTRPFGQEADVVQARRFGDYEIGEEIARGGMGVVYRARQVSLNRPVALKMILASQLASDVELRRFRLEAEAAARLDHPGIVPIHEVGSVDDQHFFSMGLVEGGSLANLVEEGPLPPRRAAELVRQVAEAVQYAHAHNVVHRDLKPANVLLDEHGRPKVTDFGLAKNVEGDSGLTATGQVMGTPSYMPPEQAAGRVEEVGPLADVYALGAILYALLTGVPPFRGANVIETLQLVVEQDPRAPRSLVSAIDLDLETICLKCLRKEPAKRYASAGELAGDLRRYLDEEPVTARPIGRRERFAKWVRRNKGLATGLAAGVLALLVGTGLATWQAIRATTAYGVANDRLRERDAALASERRALGRERRAREAAEREELVARTARYAMQIKLANLDFDRFRVDSARSILNATEPELRGWEFDHTLARCDSRMPVFDDERPCDCVAVDREGMLVAAGGSAGIRVWRFDDRQLVAELAEDEGSVEDLCFGPHARRLAAVTADSAYVWDTSGWRLLGRVALSSPTLDRAGPRLAFGPAGERLAIVHGEKLRVWDATLKATLMSHDPGLEEPETGACTAVAFHPAGERIALQLTIEKPLESGRKEVEEQYLLLDAASGEPLARSTREGRSAALWGSPIGFHPSGGALCTKGDGGSAFRDPATLEVVRTQSGAPEAVAFVEDRIARLLPSDLEVDVRQWPELQPLFRLPFADFGAWATDLDSTPDGARLVASSGGSRGGRVVGWQFGRDDATTTIDVEAPRHLADAATRADRIAVASVEIERPSREEVLPGERPPRPKSISHVEIRSLETGRPLVSLPPVDGRLANLELGRGGRRLVGSTGGPRPRILLWDVDGRSLVREFPLTEGGESARAVVTELSVDRSATRICATFEESTSESGRIRMVVWDADSGQVVWETAWENEVFRLGGLERRNSAVLDPSGRRLLTIRGTVEQAPAKMDVTSAVTLHDLASSTRVAELTFHGRVRGGFSPNGDHVYLSGKHVERWHPESGERTSLSETAFGQLLVSPDERRLVGLSRRLGGEASVHWIDTATGQEVSRLVFDGDRRNTVRSIRLSDDGRTLIVIRRNVSLLHGPPAAY